MSRDWLINGIDEISSDCKQRFYVSSLFAQYNDMGLCNSRSQY